MSADLAIVEDLSLVPGAARLLVENAARGATLWRGALRGARWARVDAVDELRSHLVKVVYEDSGSTVWIARKRIRASYRPRAPR